MKKLRVFVPLLFLLSAPPLISGCHHAPPTITTLEGQKAYNADQAVQKLTEISNVVKDTYAAGGVSAVDAFTIIEWISGDSKANPPTQGLVQIIKQTPDQSWKTLARSAWASRIRMIFDKYPKLSPYSIVVDSVLEVL